MLDLSVAIKAILITMFTTFFISLVIRIFREKKYSTIIDLVIKSIVVYIITLITPIMGPLYILKKDKKELIIILSGARNVKSKEYKKYAKIVYAKNFNIKMGVWLFYKSLQDIHDIIDLMIQSIEVKRIDRIEESELFIIIYRQFKNMVMSSSTLNFDKRILRQG